MESYHPSDFDCNVYTDDDYGDQSDYEDDLFGESKKDRLAKIKAKTYDDDYIEY